MQEIHDVQRALDKESYTPGLSFVNLVPMRPSKERYIKQVNKNLLVTRLSQKNRKLYTMLSCVFL